MINPLQGLRVLNTRPLSQADKLNHAIQNAGGIPLSLPGLTIEATKTDWLDQMPDLKTIRQAIFVSTNAVHYFFNAFKEANILWPDTIRVTAVGMATSAALLNHGVHAHHIPQIASSEHLLKSASLQNINNQTILLIKGDGGRTLISEEVQARGAKLTSLIVYRKIMPKIKQEYIDSLWRDDAVDIILFTSQQAMQNIFHLFGEKRQAWLQSKSCLVISNRLAEIASLFGIRTIITCQYDDILDALVRYKKGHRHDNTSKHND